MDRYAIFVDAGYLFAQGSALVMGGQKRKRQDCLLNEKAAITELMTVARKSVGSLPLLRIYWYDGGNRWPSAEQEILADADHVKLRLGFLNSAGQQKGVDSLIVTDLIELARNRAISDAVLLSGDEDIRVGVQVAQTLGVRVHLVGIHPGRGSQSKNLRQESDSIHEMKLGTVSKFLSCKPLSVPTQPATNAPTNQAAAPNAPAAVPHPAFIAAQAAPPAHTTPTPATPAPVQAAAAAAVAKAAASAAAATPVAPAAALAVGVVGAALVPQADPTAAIKAVAGEVLATLTDDEVRKLEPLLAAQPGLPSNLDGKLLAKSRSALNRVLDLAERKTARGEFRQIFVARFGALPPKQVEQ